MGKFQPLPIVGGCYADDARPWSSQDCVNYLPIKAEAPGTRSEGKLVCVPGLVPFCGTNQAPIRGAHNCEGRYFVVAGTTLYKISTLGVATALGIVPGAGRVCFDHNQITGGNEVVVVNGSQGFVYNTKTGVFAQITDADFPGSAIARYLGQYILGIKPNRTGWFHSDLATATTWLSTDTYEAESSPDLLVDIQVSQGRALIMGERTIEEWVNEPTENAAFQRGSVIERGAASQFANVIMDNTLIWLGDDGIVYRLDGYTPRRISTFPIEQALSRCTLANAFAFAWEDRGHKVYYLTLPDGHTWGYDIASGLWHRRESYRLDRWIASSMTRWNGAWYAGHYDSGVIYRLDWDVMAEGCNKLVRSRTLACIHDNENRITVDAVALTVDVGTEPSIASHGPPTVTGNLPDGTVNDVVSYQYTLTGSYPGEYVTAAVTAGALPTGLSMSSAGLVTGTQTVVDSFGWVVTATGECGDSATLADAAIVSGSSWLLSGDATGSSDHTLATGNFAASEWTSVGAQDYSGFLWNNAGVVYESQDSNYHLRQSADNGATWSDWSVVAGTVSAGGGRMAFGGGYAYLCCGGQRIQYRPLTGGSWSTSADTASRANSAVYHGSSLIGVSIYASTATVSNDHGVTWAALAGSFTTQITGSPLIESDGTKLVVLFNDGSPNYNSKLAYSLDNGVSWTTAYTFASPSSGVTPASLKHHNGKWVATLSDGRIAYATNPATWTLAAQTLVVAQMTAQDGQFLAAEADGTASVSDDGGQTWTAATGLPSLNLGVGATWITPATTPPPTPTPATIYLVDETDNRLTDESGNYLIG